MLASTPSSEVFVGGTDRRGRQKICWQPPTASQREDSAQVSCIMLLSFSTLCHHRLTTTLVSVYHLFNRLRVRFLSSVPRQVHRLYHLKPPAHHLVPPFTALPHFKPLTPCYKTPKHPTPVWRHHVFTSCLSSLWCLTTLPASVSTMVSSSPGTKTLLTLQ